MIEAFLIRILGDHLGIIVGIMMIGIMFIPSIWNMLLNQNNTHQNCVNEKIKLEIKIDAIERKIDAIERDLLFYKKVQR